MHEKGEAPIEIGRLQRYAVDHVLDNNIQLFRAGRSNGKAGCPASVPVSAFTRIMAMELAKWGYEVMIFDRNEFPGGLNTYGIAAYKARAADSIRETDLVRQLGVKFQQNVEDRTRHSASKISNDNLTQCSSALAWVKRGI